MVPRGYSRGTPGVLGGTCGGLAADWRRIGGVLGCTKECLVVSRGTRGVLDVVKGVPRGNRRFKGTLRHLAGIEGYSRGTRGVPKVVLQAYSVYHRAILRGLERPSIFARRSTGGVLAGSSRCSDRVLADSLRGSRGVLRYSQVVQEHSRGTQR